MDWIGRWLDNGKPFLGIHLAAAVFGEGLRVTQAR